MGTNETINLNELTERELLIKLHTKVVELEEKVDRISAQEIELRVKIATLETRAKVTATAYGFGVSFATTIISIIIRALIK